MKFVDPHSSADPDAAARKLVEIANGVEAVQLHRTCQRAVSSGWRQRRAISRRDRARHCGWLVMAI